MENLTNLDKLIGVGKFEVIAFPIKIIADSSMVRAVAKINGFITNCNNESIYFNY